MIQPDPRPVAVLDDDVQFIRMVERALKTEGLRVQPVTTPDLDEAVRVIASTGSFAALVDIYMYGENAGFDLVERLRHHAATASLPIIVTSGAYREIARQVPFLQRHRCSVLAKPFPIDELLARISDAQDGRTPPVTPREEAIEDEASVMPILRPQGGLMRLKFMAGLRHST